MIINKSIKEKLPVKDLNNLYVVADFDRTITNGNSKTSWSILSNSDLVSAEYKSERDELYAKYRPIELDESMNINERNKLIKEWFIKHISLFVKYKITDKVFEEAATNLKIMEFRRGARNFIKFLYENNIPLIIISAGIGNFIECFLELNDSYYDNVYVSSNKIIFKNGIACGVDKNIIHSLNKNEVSLPKDIKDKIANRNNVILLGDQIGDLKMVNKADHDEVLTIGFMSEENNDFDRYKNSFDILCYGKDNYYSLMKKIFDS
jgi:cytosolic 5'-nucleotidase 3